MVRISFFTKFLIFTGIFIGMSFVFNSLTDTSVDAQNQPPAPSVHLTARLTGEPIQGVRPRGAASYMEFQNGVRVLTVAVDQVRFGNGTNLNVIIDGEPAGQITVRLGAGYLRLSTLQNDNVPTPASGSTIVIRRGAQIVLAGSFGTAPAPPTSRLFAPMEGAPVDGAAPRGVAHYAEFGGDNPENVGDVSRRLAVFVHRVRLAAGSVLTVSVEGVPVGSITLNDEGDGGLRLNSANGDSVPEISVDTNISVNNGNAAVLAGTFREFDRPLPPRFRRNRVFGGHMNGRQVVPAVQTQAKGRVIVVVNREHTRIGVKYAFRGLSGEQTTAAIHGPARRGENAEAIFDLAVVGGTQGISGFQSFAVTPEQIAQLRSGHWYMQIGSAVNPGGEIRGQIRSRHRRDRFLGDDTSDIAVYRPGTGTFYVKNGPGFIAENLGRAGDIPVSGDFDGDGSTDFAVFGNGSWLVRRSSDNGTTTRQFGLSGDIPVQGDFDGDGLADLAVFRPSNGVWYVQKSDGSGYIIVQFGLGGDKPVASDFDGDGLADISVFRQSDGTWHWLRSSDGGYGAVKWGMNGDVPVRADFDGDGIDDISVFRNSNGAWYSILSSTGGFDIRSFGTSGDIPSAADFDADGNTDYAVFRPSTRTWYIWKSSTDTFDFEYFGSPGDIPASAN